MPHLERAEALNSFKRAIISEKHSVSRDPNLICFTLLTTAGAGDAALTSETN